MPKTTQSPDQSLDELPGFGAPDPEMDQGLAESDEAPEAPILPDQPTTSESHPSQPASAPEAPSAPSAPTGTSTDEPRDRIPDLELTEGLAYLTGGLFELVGHLLNRMVRIRRRQQTTLWLVTDAEAEAFAAPMARIAERRLPDELKGGDAKDLIIAGSVGVEYATHNAAGVPGVRPQPVQPPYPGADPIDREDLARRAEESQPAQPPPPPPPSAQQGAPPAEAPPLVGPEI